MNFKRTQREAEITFVWCSVNLFTFISIQTLKYFKFKNYECPDFDTFNNDDYKKSVIGYSVLNFFYLAFTYFSYFWNFVQFISIIILSAVYRIKKSNMISDEENSDFVESPKRNKLNHYKETELTATN